MAKPGYRKLVNQLVIKGKHKPGFFSKTREFELQIYYTPLKKKIIEIIPTGVILSDMDLPFKSGDDISLAREWCKKNNHEVHMDIERF